MILLLLGRPGIPGLSLPGAPLFTQGAGGGTAECQASRLSLPASTAVLEAGLENKRSGRL